MSLQLGVFYMTELINESRLQSAINSLSLFVSATVNVTKYKYYLLVDVLNVCNSFLSRTAANPAMWYLINGHEC